MATNNILPILPFKDFKWKWASYQCTEGINDPVVLLGVLFRMAKLEGRYRYSSDEFAQELINLANDLESSGVDVDLRGRTGARNIIRNSGQYWKALNLIPSDRTGGRITLTDFGRKVANHTISQTEFSAQTIISFKLPNRAIQSPQEISQWNNAGLEIRPLKLILSIVSKLWAIDHSKGYITTNELVKIVIPLSGTANRPIGDFVLSIIQYRSGHLDITNWPNCCPASNDFRIAREFLLFLSYYGYLNKYDADSRENEEYHYNSFIDAEIQEILKTKLGILDLSVISDTERKIVAHYQKRPNQAKFRKVVLEACPRCVISNVEMPEVLEAAHIKPFKYKGEDIAANGFMMRLDIHLLFDAGHLRISADGDVFLSDKARWSYGSTIPPRIFIPDYVNKDFLRWRWDNYNGV